MRAVQAPGTPIMRRRAKAARPACRATPPARLSAATMLSAIFSRPAPRDAVTVSAGMKKKVAGADSSGERLPLLPGPTPPRTEASAVGLHAGPSLRRHTPTQPGRSRSRRPDVLGNGPPCRSYATPCRRRSPRLLRGGHPVAARLSKPQWQLETLAASCAPFRGREHFRRQG